MEGLYKKHGPLALIGSRTKLMQHWADRIDDWLDPRKVEARMLESPNIRLVNVALFSPLQADVIVLDFCAFPPGER